MNRKIIFFLLLLGLVIHISMFIYYIRRISSNDRNVILTLLSFMIISSIIQLYYLF